MAFHLCRPVVAECAQICLAKGQQTVGDVVLRTVAAKGKIGMGKDLYIVKPAEDAADDALRIQTALHHVGDRGNSLQVPLKAVNHRIRCARQRLDKEAARAEALQLGTDEDTKSDRGRCLLRGVEVVDEIVGDLSADDIDAARHGLFQPREARDREDALPNAAADIDLAVRIQRQMDMRMIDTAAHRAIRRRIRRHRAERSISLEFDRDGFLVLEICGKEERARHRAPECRRRNGPTVMPPHCLGDHIRRHRRKYAQLSVCRRCFYQLIHIALPVERALMQNIARINIKNPNRAVLEDSDGIAPVGALRERRRTGVEKHRIAALFENGDVHMPADKEISAQMLRHFIFLRIRHNGIAVRDDDAPPLPHDVGVGRQNGKCETARIHI